MKYKTLEKANPHPQIVCGWGLMFIVWRATALNTLLSFQFLIALTIAIIESPVTEISISVPIKVHKEEKMKCITSIILVFRFVY